MSLHGAAERFTPGMQQGMSAPRSDLVAGATRFSTVLEGITMDHSEAPNPTRRRLIGALAATPLLLAIPSLFTLARRGRENPADPAIQTREPTLACGDDDDNSPTEAQTEGPYFTPNSPARVSLLEADLTGIILVIRGKVLTRSCKPVAHALLDFWQADANGTYDNQGYRLRGHQFTDRDGNYVLRTVVPGLYAPRTRHIHVKVQAPNQPILTTQLYFPGEPGNARDGIFQPSLLMTITPGNTPQEGRFDFVVNLA